MDNLFSDLPMSQTEEVISILAANEHVRIERIVSRGNTSPEGFWYDQSENEWVVVLRGAAKLRYEGETEPVTLHAGDHVLIPAHRRHRVEWTSPDEPTIWLAVFFGEVQCESSTKE